METIDLDNTPTRRGSWLRRLPTSGALLIIMVLAILVVAGGIAFAVSSAPAASPLTSPSPAVNHIELRIEGDGVGQIARVWDNSGKRDVDTWGVAVTAAWPRAVLYTVQAGVNASASCVILIDGDEVIRELAEPLTVATCVWVR